MCEQCGQQLAGATPPSVQQAGETTAAQQLSLPQFMGLLLGALAGIGAVMGGLVWLASVLQQSGVL